MTTTQPPVFEGVDAPHAASGLRGVIGRRRADRRRDDAGDRGIVSDYDRKSRGVKVGMSGNILSGPSGEESLSGGSFRVTQVLDERKSVARCSLSSVGKNTRVAITVR